MGWTFHRGSYLEVTAPMVWDALGVVAAELGEAAAALVGGAALLVAAVSAVYGEYSQSC